MLNPSLPRLQGAFRGKRCAHLPLAASPSGESVQGSLCREDVLTESEILNYKLSERSMVLEYGSWVCLKHGSYVWILLSPVFILMGDSVINGDSRCCVGLWRRRAVTVTAMEKGRSKSTSYGTSWVAAWTKFLTMSSWWNNAPVMPCVRGQILLFPALNKESWWFPVIHLTPKGCCEKFLHV